MYVYCDILLLYVLKEFRRQHPEDGELIAPKGVGAMARINCRIVHLFVLHVLFTYGINYVKGIFCNVQKHGDGGNIYFVKNLNIVIIS
jgi:hypothetical protein